LLLILPANMLMVACDIVFNPLKTLIQAELHWSDAKTALPGFATQAAAVVAAPLLGIVASQERASHRALLTAGATLVSVAACLTAAVRDVWLICMLRLLVGAGSTAAAVVIPSLLVDFYPLADRSYVFALYQLSGLLGGALGYAWPSVIAETAGWHVSVMAVGIPSLVVACSLHFIAEPVKGIHDASAPNEEEATLISKYASVLGNHHFQLVVAINVMNMFAERGAAEWFPTFLQRYDGQTVAAAGVECAVAGILGGSLGCGAGAIAVKHSQSAAAVKNAELLVPAFAGGCSILACLTLVSAQISASSAIVLLSAVFMSCFATSTVCLAVLLTRVLPSNQMSLAVSLQTPLCGLGTAIAPLLIGWLSDRAHSLRSAMHLPIVVQLAAGLGLLFGSQWLSPSRMSNTDKKDQGDASLLSLFATDGEAEMPRGGRTGLKSVSYGAI